MTMHNLHTTDELIAAYEESGPFNRAMLEAAIPAAIDALYTGRDSGLTMHGSGAAAGVAVLTALLHPGELNTPENQQKGEELANALVTATLAGDSEATRMLTDEINSDVPNSFMVMTHLLIWVCNIVKLMAHGEGREPSETWTDLTAAMRRFRG